jgi:hypothetical protein
MECFAFLDATTTFQDVLFCPNRIRDHREFARFDVELTMQENAERYKNKH